MAYPICPTHQGQACQVQLRVIVRRQSVEMESLLKFGNLLKSWSDSKFDFVLNKLFIVIGRKFYTFKTPRTFELTPIWLKKILILTFELIVSFDIFNPALVVFNRINWQANQFNTELLELGRISGNLTKLSGADWSIVSRVGEQDGPAILGIQPD